MLGRRVEMRDPVRVVNGPRRVRRRFRRKEKKRIVR